MNICWGEFVCKVLLSDDVVLKNWFELSVVIYFLLVRFMVFIWILMLVSVLFVGK